MLNERLALIKKERELLLSNLLLFTATFYKLRTGREYVISRPPGRLPHQIEIARCLHDVFSGRSSRLVINCPPRYGKSELAIHFVAWCLAHYPNSQFIYVSYSHTLAATQTQAIKEIISLPKYKEYFGVTIKRDSRAKDFFETTVNGRVYAAGSGGTIVGFGAGLYNTNHFGGCIVVDDIHKPDEVTSESMRQSTLSWHLNTLQSRVNSATTPIISIGQRVHEDDYCANLANSYDGKDWQFLVLPALDDHNNPLDPDKHSKDELLRMQKVMNYEFAAQYQQNPIPAGGGLYKVDWFVQLPEMPEIICTFITADTAETDKTYNDATVFSYWGLYKIQDKFLNTETYALHWIDCLEERVEPKDLEELFYSFYRQCSIFQTPKFIAIEKKSTGTTLFSVLKNKMRGVQVIPIDRPGNIHKSDRFIKCQSYVAKGLISLPTYGKHTTHVLNHMKNITANDTHKFDDIADTMEQAIYLTFTDKAILKMHTQDDKKSTILSKMADDFAKENRLRQQYYGNSQYY